MDINADIRLELKKRDIKRDNLLKEIRVGYLWTIFQVYLIFTISSTIIVYLLGLMINYVFPEFSKFPFLNLFLISSVIFVIPCYFGARNLRSKYNDELITIDQEFIRQVTHIESENNLKIKSE